MNVSIIFLWAWTKVQKGEHIMKKLINLTPHAVTFVNADGDTYVVEPSGMLAIVSSEIKMLDIIEVDGFKIPHTKTVFGEVEGLPDPEDGVIYIVSSLVAGRVPDRDDVMIPNQSLRDDKGRITGCKSLGSI